MSVISFLLAEAKAECNKNNTKQMEASDIVLQMISLASNPVNNT